MLDLIRQHAQSTGVKIAFALIIIVFVFWGVTGSNQQSPGTIATVDGKPILMRDFDEVVRNQASIMRSYNPEITDEDMKAMGLYQQALSLLVTGTLLEQEAKRLGISVSAAELRRDILTQEAFFGPDGKFDPERYRQVVGQMGYTDVRFEQKRAQELLQAKLFDYVTMGTSLLPGEVGRLMAFRLEQRKAAYVLFAAADQIADIKVTDEEIKAFYTSNQQAYAEPDRTALRILEVNPVSVASSIAVSTEDLEKRSEAGPLEFRLSQIFRSLPQDSPEEEQKEIRDKMAAVLAELKAGGDFAAIAARESEDPSAQRGGDVGWITKNTVFPEVREAIDALRPGEISDVITFPNGLAILRLEETSPNVTLPREQYLEEFRSIVQEEKAEENFAEYSMQAEEALATGKNLDAIAAEFKIEPREIPLTPRTALSEAMGLRRPPAAGTFDGAPGSMIPMPLETTEGFVVAEIVEQKGAGVKSFDEVKDQIRETLVNQEAMRRAYRAAENVRKEFDAGVPDSFKSKVFHTEAFSRTGEIIGLGSVPTLSEALFTAKPNTWLERPYEVPSGVVLAMVEEVIPVSEEQLNMAETLAGPQLLEAKRQELFSVFMNDLQQRSKVNVFHQELFQ